MPLISGWMTYYALLRNYLPDRATARNAFPILLKVRRPANGRPYTYTVKSRLAASFGGVVDREGKLLDKKAFGYEIPGHPSKGLAERSWAGWLLGLIPLGLLGWAGWLGVPGLGPMVPTMPPFSCRGGRSSPIGKKKRTSLIVIFIGNSLPLMVLNFQCKFFNFLKVH